MQQCKLWWVGVVQSLPLQKVSVHLFTSSLQSCAAPFCNNLFPLAALQPIRQGPSTQTLSHLATTPINLNKATWRLFWQGQCNDQSIDVVSVPSISLSSVCLSICHPSAGFYTGFFEKGGKSSDAPTYQETVPITNALTARIRLWKKSRCF